MPLPPAPVGGDSYVSEDVSIPTSSTKDSLPNQDPNTFGAGRSGSADIEPLSISPVYHPYATNYPECQMFKYDAAVATQDITSAPRIILADASGGNLTLRLPSASLYIGKTVTIMRYDNTANTVTITSSEGTIRTTAAVGALLATQYGVIDYTASSSRDPAGVAADDILWIGR